ncbi:MAG: hypothetical protein M3P49_10325 [Actinomycetota bacterium]|nr:hypothetical protein [Actinomycetota bacterium]
MRAGITMEAAEAAEDQNRAEIWLALAAMLERGERGEVRLSLVVDERVPRTRRASRRGGRGPLAA